MAYEEGAGGVFGEAVKIDFARFFEFVSKTGYDGNFTVEATAHDIEGNVDIEMLNDQFKRIREYVGET